MLVGVAEEVERQRANQRGNGGGSDTYDGGGDGAPSPQIMTGGFLSGIIEAGPGAAAGAAAAAAALPPAKRRRTKQRLCPTCGEPFEPRKRRCRNPRCADSISTGK